MASSDSLSYTKLLIFLLAIYCSLVESRDIPSSHSNLNLLPEECGLKANGRIANGNATEAFEYPWMAVVQYNNGNRMVDICGGTLINKRYVLTAAHCINSMVSVRLGEHTKNLDEDCIIFRDSEGKETERDCADPTEDFEIESHEIHPDYEAPVYGNDIGLLRLEKDVIMKDHISPICLPVTQELRTKTLEKFVVTGWGATENGPSSNVLMQAILPRVDIVKCRQIYAHSTGKVFISDKQLCAGGQNKVDSCWGDSGGPLGFTVEYGKGLARFVQFGIVSYGVTSCGKVSIPGIYTRVSSYMDWILDKIEP